MKWMAFTLVHIGMSSIHIHFQWTIHKNAIFFCAARTKSPRDKGGAYQVDFSE